MIPQQVMTFSSRSSVTYTPLCMKQETHEFDGDHNSSFVVMLCFHFFSIVSTVVHIGRRRNFALVLRSCT